MIAGVGGVVILLKILTIVVMIILTLNILFAQKSNENQGQNPQGDESVPSGGRESTPEKEPLPAKEKSVEKK